jgi:hypothetical protein
MNGIGRYGEKQFKKVSLRLIIIHVKMMKNIEKQGNSSNRRPEKWAKFELIWQNQVTKI